MLLLLTCACRSSPRTVREIPQPSIASTFSLSPSPSASSATTSGAYMRAPQRATPTRSHGIGCLPRLYSLRSMFRKEDCLHQLPTWSPQAQAQPNYDFFAFTGLFETHDGLLSVPGWSVLAPQSTNLLCMCGRSGSAVLRGWSLEFWHSSAK